MSLSKEEMMEVMAVFKEESRELLDTLTSRLPELKTNPKSAAAIEILHRTSHSLKGAARMLGLTPLEQIGQALENGFKSAKEGRITISNDQIAAVEESLKMIQTLIDKLSAEGTTEGIDIQAVLNRLNAFK